MLVSYEELYDTANRTHSREECFEYIEKYSQYWDKVIEGTATPEDYTHLIKIAKDPEKADLYSDALMLYSQAGNFRGKLTEFAVFANSGCDLSEVLPYYFEHSETWKKIQTGQATQEDLQHLNNTDINLSAYYDTVVLYSSIHADMPEEEWNNLDKFINDIKRQTLKEELQSQKEELHNNIIAESQSMRFDMHSTPDKETENGKIVDKDDKETENGKISGTKDSKDNKIPLEYQNKER